MSTEETSKIFCLWDEWYEIEEELAEIAPTVRVQCDAMRRAVLKDYSGPTIPPVKEPAVVVVVVVVVEKEGLPEPGAAVLEECLVVGEGDEDVHKKQPDLSG